MKPEEQQLLVSLLKEQQTLSLSLLVDNEPYIGLLPYTLSKEFDTFFVHASGLAQHSKGLGEGKSFSALIHSPVMSNVDPLRVPRIVLKGKSMVVEKGTRDYENERVRYIERFPQSAVTFQLGDFNLYRLDIEHARFVVDFGRTLSLTVDHLRKLKAL